MNGDVTPERGLLSFIHFQSHIYTLSHRDPAATHPVRSVSLWKYIQRAVFLLAPFQSYKQQERCILRSVESAVTLSVGSGALWLQLSFYE